MGLPQEGPGATSTHCAHHPFPGTTGLSRATLSSVALPDWIQAWAVNGLEAGPCVSQPRTARAGEILGFQGTFHLNKGFQTHGSDRGCTQS